jgi:hypothetical protein
MDKQYVTENNKSRARLRQLVNNITDDELKLVIYKEGWTVAAALAHLAFWDERRRVLVKIWRQKGVAPFPYIEDIVNDALIPLLLAIPPRKAADLCVLTAEALDKELEELPAEMVTSIAGLGDRHAPDRSVHRKMHLDEIEALLEAKRGKK